MHLVRGLIAITVMAAASIPASLADPAADPWGGKRVFEARLSANNQPVVTNSPGTGSARFVLDIRTNILSWEIHHDDLTSSPIAVGLHGPAQPGTNGAQLFSLAGNSIGSRIVGTAKVPAGQIQYMLLGWTYVLISTKRYPEGELRGKVDVVPPDRSTSSHDRVDRERSESSRVADEGVGRSLDSAGPMLFSAPFRPRRTSPGN